LTQTFLLQSGRIEGPGGTPPFDSADEIGYLRTENFLPLKIDRGLVVTSMEVSFQFQRGAVFESAETDHRRAAGMGRHNSMDEADVVRLGTSSTASVAGQRQWHRRLFLMPLAVSVQKLYSTALITIEEKVAYEFDSEASIACPEVNPVTF